MLAILRISEISRGKSEKLWKYQELSGKKQCRKIIESKLLKVNTETRLGEEQNVQENRKRKAMISNLDQQKRSKLDEVKLQAQELDSRQPN